MADFSGKLWMGPGTFEVPLELFELNRQRLVDRLKPKTLGKAIIVLQGGDEVPFYDTDTSYHIFRQVRYFNIHAHKTIIYIVPYGQHICFEKVCATLSKTCQLH